MTNFRTLENIKIEELLEVFNLSFSDYFVPLKMSIEQLKYKFQTENFAPGFSVGAFSGNKLIGFIFHFKDKNLVYNGGTGVIPSFRGQKLTEKMYDFIIPILKNKNLKSISLEVLNQNIQAIKSYQKVGFVDCRKLKCYKGVLPDFETSNTFKIKELNNYNWNEMTSFWDFYPTWQSSIQTIERQKKNNRSFGAYLDDKLIGYIIYNPKNLRIQQISTSKSFRQKGVAKVLLKNIKPNSEISIVNIDDKSLETLKIFENFGFENYVNQIEMKLNF